MLLFKKNKKNKKIILNIPLLQHCLPATGDDTSEEARSNCWAKTTLIRPFKWKCGGSTSCSHTRARTYSWISYLWHGSWGKQISEMSSNLRREDCNRLFISTLLTPYSGATSCYLSIYLIFDFPPWRSQALWGAGRSGLKMRFIIKYHRFPLRILVMFLSSEF